MIGPFTASWKSRTPGLGSRDHQVARVVVAVDEHARLREIVVEDRARNAARERLLAAPASSATPRCLRDVPVGKERRARARAAPRRTAAARRRAWRAASGSARRSRRRRAPARDAASSAVEIGARAEVGEEQEAALEIVPRALRGAWTPARAQQRRDVHERPAVLHRRRRVHRDQRRVSAPRRVRA